MNYLWENQDRYNQSVCNLPFVCSSWSNRGGYSGTQAGRSSGHRGGAVNQAIKALILATGYLKGDGIDIVAIPEFVEVEIEEKVRTAIKLVIEPRQVISTDSSPSSRTNNQKP
jgi:hypothetical protein